MIPQMRPPGRFTEGLKDMLRFLPEGMVMVEIGSYAGESTAIFASKASRIYAVDPWQDNWGSANPAVRSFPMSEVEKAFDERMSAFGDKIIKLKMTSEMAALRIPDRSIDMAYLDGCHFKEAVKLDAAIWLYKIKPGGFIGGHDYNDEVWGKEVRPAVDETLGTPWRIFADGSWLVKLPDHITETEDWKEHMKGIKP